MKILFVGFGSIGQRHLQNIKKLKEAGKINDNLEFFALTKSMDDNRVIIDGKSYHKSIQEYYGLTTLKTIIQAKKIKPDIVFVVNPSSLHVETALKFAETGSNLFIEKPLADGLKGLKKLSGTIKKRKLISHVGFQTRFNPLIRQIKEIISINRKKIITASFEWNTFLPLHHKYENYSNGYAARKNLGGGVVFGLIHEIDLIYYFFGLPKKVFSAGGKLSDLKTDTEDTVMSILTYKSGNKNMLVYLNLSYAQTKEVRKFKVQFTDSTLFVDLTENKYEVYDRDGILVREQKDISTRNELFMNEIFYFLECVKKNKDSLINVEEGKNSLQIALEIKNMIKNK